MLFYQTWNVTSYSVTRVSCLHPFFSYLFFITKCMIIVNRTPKMALATIALIILNKYWLEIGIFSYEDSCYYKFLPSEKESSILYLSCKNDEYKCRWRRQYRAFYIHLKYYIIHYAFELLYIWIDLLYDSSFSCRRSIPGQRHFMVSWEINR